MLALVPLQMLGIGWTWSLVISVLFAAFCAMVSYNYRHSDHVGPFDHRASHLDDLQAALTHHGIGPSPY